MEKVCTEGKSLFDEEEEESLAAFWQYPRPSLYPSRDSDQPRVANFMGYSVLNPPFRYVPKNFQTLFTAIFPAAG